MRLFCLALFTLVVGCSAQPEQPSDTGQQRAFATLGACGANSDSECKNKNSGDSCGTGKTCQKLTGQDCSCTESSEVEDNETR
jgi:hypothetical protein